MPEAWIPPGWSDERNEFAAVGLAIPCFTYRIDPSVAPKTFDLLASGPASAGETAKDDLSAVGIYQIDGDKLKICLTRISVLRQGRPAAEEFCDYARLGRYPLRPRAFSTFPRRQGD